MNQAEAYAEPVHGGYHGFFRLDWRTEHFVVRTRAGGEVVRFLSAAEAECAAWRVMRKIEAQRMVRSGPKMGDPLAAAEAYFMPRVVRQKGKTRRIDVEIA